MVFSRYHSDIDALYISKIQPFGNVFGIRLDPFGIHLVFIRMSKQSLALAQLAERRTVVSHRLAEKRSIQLTRAG